MLGHVILSHGSNSGPDAIKVSALAKVAEALGWTTSRPDYREDDRPGYAGSITPRLQRLLAAMRAAPHPLVLAGSSMGAFVSGLASKRAPCDGVFLMALPTAIPGYAEHFGLAPHIPSMLVHGFADELCAVDAALAFAREQSMPALLVADDHRLARQLGTLERQFRLFLQQWAD